MASDAVNGWVRSEHSENHNLFSCFFLSIILAGCATGETITRLSPGMSQAEVVRVMGRPDGLQREGEHTVLRCTNRLISGWSRDRADYFVILKNDELTAFGPGEVREKNVGGVNTLLILGN